MFRSDYNPTWPCHTLLRPHMDLTMTGCWSTTNDKFCIKVINQFEQGNFSSKTVIHLKEKIEIIKESSKMDERDGGKYFIVAA